MKQKKLNVLIRTSGGTHTKEELGFGHIYRCVNLATALEYHNIFFLLEDFGGAKKILNDSGYHRIIPFKKNRDRNSELKKTVSCIKKNKIDILIIDRYNISKRYVSRMRRYITTILISDLLNLDYDVDLLINGFIGLKNQIKKNQYGSKCLFGPKYQILDKRFAKPQPQSKKKFKLLITFGGFDKNNIIKIILRLLKATLPIKTKIILGPGTPITNEIKFLSRKSRYLHIKQKTRDMRKEILDAEFGICSGGITTYEFAALKVPFAIVCQAKHQLITAKKWQEKRVAINLGFANKNIEKKLERILLKISKDTEIRLRKIVVDGHGSQRVAKEIIKLSKNTALKAK